MGWLDFLKSGDNKAGEGGTPTDTPSAVEYVEWLTKFMLRSSKTELAIDTAALLPGAMETGDNAPPCIPSPEAVINRLKLISGLNPVHLSAPASGSFVEERGGHTLVVTTRFDDSGEHSICMLQIRVRPRSG